MIERLEIRGFKALGVEGVDLPLAPITLLLGANSVGKSSIFQMLLAMQQSWSKFAYIGQLSPVGSGTDLGRFCNLQHRFGEYVCREVMVRIELEGNRDLEMAWSDSHSVEVPHEVAEPPPGWPDRWSVKGLADQGDLGYLKVGNFRFLSQWDAQRLTLRLTLSGESVDAWLNRNPGHELSSLFQKGLSLVFEIIAEDDREFVPSADWAEGCEVDPTMIAELNSKMKQKPEDPDTLWGAAHRALVSVASFRKVLRSMCHIGGLRERGQRLYEVRVSDHPWNVGPSGERIADLLAYSDTAVDTTNHLLEAAEVGYQVRLMDFGSMASVREIQLIDHRPGRGKGNSVALPDVGTGISQMLPLAVQIATFLESGRFSSDPLLLVEQPEIHLHPRLQAHMVKMLAKAIKPDIDVPQRVQFLIETHSEHLVRGLGLLIERGELKPEDVSLIYLSREAETGEIGASRIKFRDDGRFQKRWPEGFFPEARMLEDGEFPKW